ncbi:hypothetical protein PENTCL1PPCAC_30242 [Pristionchus entomophagus]|uniref:CUB domain-containing protein n=1 Tax=Pristionchus entomophagus TaxID=358040 RepID=A0AAV5UP13_9BILA|nr:hypothetical protein PENTCL1PPCAC_30242 [Pristionchus entomophagus]
MSTNNGFESKGKEHQIQYGSLIAFCDPSQAVYDSQSADSKIISRPIIGLTHFSCQEDYHIETRRKINNQLEPEFMGTTSIVCEKESTEYKFVIKRKGEMIKQERNEDFNIRCAKRTVGQQASATSPIAIVVIVGGSIILLVMFGGCAIYYVRQRRKLPCPAPFHLSSAWHSRDFRQSSVRPRSRSILVD